MTYADAYNLRTSSVSFNNVADAIDGTLSRQWGGTSTGAANTYAVTCSPAWASYESGRLLAFVPNATNTGATTINVNGLGAKTVRYKNKALVGGELVSDVEALLVYDGTIFELINHGGGWATWTPSYSASGSMTYTSVATNVAQYQRHGNMVFFMVNSTGTTGGTASNELRISLPVALVGGTSIMSVYIVIGPVISGISYHSASTTLGIGKYDGSNYPLQPNLTVSVSGFYRA